jgi:Nickel responsive protein SCO4226-like
MHTKPPQQVSALAALALLAATADAGPAAHRHLYLDVHELGSVSAAAVASAHQKDLATQDQYGVKFLRYWVDEANGRVYCLSEAPSARAVTETHAHAHGLLPEAVYPVASGEEAPESGKQALYLDVHHVGAGNVTAADVAQAHAKDLATQASHGVRFINYWVDPQSGDIFCLSEAPNAEAVLATHRDAHGLVSDEIAQVTEGR